MIIIRQGLFAFLVVVSVNVVSSLEQLVGEDERSNAAEEGAEEAPAPEGAAVEFGVHATTTSLVTIALSDTCIVNPSIDTQGDGSQDEEYQPEVLGGLAVFTGLVDLLNEVIVHNETIDTASDCRKEPILNPSSVCTKLFHCLCVLMVNN